MANFGVFFRKLLRLEGGYANHKNDKGGCTNKGITINTFRDYYGAGLDCNDLKEIKEEQVEHIYKDGYWDKCWGDKIADSNLAHLLVDFAINSGCKKAIKTLQSIIGVDDDGIMGKITLNAINSYYNPKELFEELKEARKKHYLDIVEKNPSQKVFLKGWLNRLDGYEWRE